MAEGSGTSHPKPSEGIQEPAQRRGSLGCGATRQGWNLSCDRVHTLGKASRLPDRRLLFCDTGEAVASPHGD